MDTAMEEKRGTYTALSLSLALHVILLLAAGALGLFSIAAPQDAGTPVEVTLYDAGPAAADAGDAAPAAAVSAVSDVVIADKTLPPETTQETAAQTNPTAALRTDGTAASGSSAPTGSSNGKGDAAGTTNGSAAERRMERLHRPPRRPSVWRQACGQRQNPSTPLSLSKMISKARSVSRYSLLQTVRSSLSSSHPPRGIRRWIERRLRRGTDSSLIRATTDAEVFFRGLFISS